MIHTILDTDLYKFTTSYAYIKLFPYAMGTFSFKDRDDTAYTDTFLKELQEAVDSLAQTVLTAEELEYMTRHCRFLPRVYWEWLSSFRFQPDAGCSAPSACCRRRASHARSRDRPP